MEASALDLVWTSDWLSPAATPKLMDRMLLLREYLLLPSSCLLLLLLLLLLLVLTKHDWRAKRCDCRGMT